MIAEQPHSSTGPLIAVGPKLSQFVADAIASGGGTATEVGAGGRPDALVWMFGGDTAALSHAIDVTPTARWVQLPFAGVEREAAAGLFGDGRAWTSAKGCYAEPVAEHALMLALAGLRVLPTRVRARSWGEASGISLYDAPVTILGGGGITAALLRLLAPWRVDATVVRRSLEPMEGAARIVATDRMLDALPEAQVVFLALALTPVTAGIIDAEALAAMNPRAWLVNVARGGHVDTTALVAALHSEVIAGAALDVTDPEPLPDGHPLWDAPNCIITPHVANTFEMARPLLAARIRDNVARFAAGEPLIGNVDPEGGY